MARASEYPSVSAFSQAFAEALGADMKRHSVTHQAVADVIERSRPFVSDQVSGKRPVDTDVVVAVAHLAGTTPPALIRRVLAAMPPESREGVVVELASRRPPATPAAVKKAARKPPRPPSGRRGE